VPGEENRLSSYYGRDSIEIGADMKELGKNVGIKEGDRGSD
jgi:hypothetical protein